MGAYSRILTPWDSQPQEPAELKSEFGPVSGWLGSSPFAAVPAGRADPLFSSGVLDVGIGGQGARFDNNGSQRVQIPGAVSPGSEFIAVVVYENTTANTSGIIMAGKTNFAQSNGFMFSSKTNVNTLEINGGNGSTFPTIAATGAGSADGTVKTVVVRYRGTSADVFLNGVSLGTVTIAAAGTWPSGLGIGNYSGTGGGNLPNRRFYMGAVVRHGDPLQLSADPWQLFAPRSIWVPVSASAPAPSPTRSIVEVKVPWDSQPQEATDRDARLSREALSGNATEPVTWVSSDGSGVSSDGLSYVANGTRIGYRFLKTPFVLGTQTGCSFVVRFLGGTAGQGICGLGATGGSAGNTLFRLTNSSGTAGRLTFTSQDSAGTLSYNTESSAGPLVNDGKWHTAVVVLSLATGGTLEYYVDGIFGGSVSRGSAPAATTFNSLDVLGSRRGGSTFANNSLQVSLVSVVYDKLAPEEARALSANPWQLFTPRSIWVPVSAGASGTTVTGNLGTASASGYTATIGANRLVAGALGTATASGYTSTVGVNKSVAGIVGVANAIGYQATISTTSDTTVNGVLGTASASGYTATIGVNRLIAGVLGTATATGYTATVANTNDTTVNSNLGVAAATGFTATIGANRTVAGIVGVATAVGFTATVVAGGSPVYSENSGLWLDIGSKLSLPLDPPRMPNWNTAGRPSAPQDYEYGFNTTTGAIEVWTGSAWV